ncbi:MAG: hypothetical protein IT435_02565 [Phycisphaerales bacterium]|nr:hypothetical protein [Phycisphaerales bacterium]
MTLICYQPRKFSASSKEIIRRANEIIRDYQQQGLDLTLRQVYYVFVSKGWIPNNQTEYKRLGSILNDARMAGEISWEAIEDRTRNLRGRSHWADPANFLRDTAHWYAEDLWSDQDHYVEVWIEKDALVGVLQAVCPRNDVPYFSCRGYTSQSEMWSAAIRLNRAARRGDRQAVVIHLGDHDPSGVDMSRDIRDRLNGFSNIRFKDEPAFDPDWEPKDIEVRRIALTMDQVREYNPPPNPAKMTDARAQGYVAEHGDESWELDALEPRTLIALIQAEIDSCKDQERWDAAVEQQEANRTRVIAASHQLDRKPIKDILTAQVKEAKADMKRAKPNSSAYAEAQGRLNLAQRLLKEEE